MLNFLSFASTMCCSSRNVDEDLSTPKHEEVKTNNLKGEVEESFMIWTLKHHIDINYPKKDKHEKADSKEDEANSTAHHYHHNFLSTMTTMMNTSISISEEYPNNKKTHSCDNFRVPLLNFDIIKNLNYDSEKEVYHNMEDKLKKIKKRFDMIKEMK